MTFRVFIIGPCQSGKSCIANVLADVSDTLNQKSSQDSLYHPTVGVRILEVEKKLQFNDKTIKDLTLPVELWDCSGNFERYANAWKKLGKEAHAVLFITSEKVSTEMDSWQSCFPHLKSQQCMVFVHGSTGKKSFKVSNKQWAKAPIAFTQLEQEQELRQEFDRLLMQAVIQYRENKEKEETSIVEHIKALH